MAHKGKGGKKNKPQRDAKYARHYARREERKRTLQLKRQRRHNYWRNNELYQVHQKERAERLVSFRSQSSGR